MPLAVVVHLAFALDIGDEIDLDLARADASGRAWPDSRGGKRTPESIGYRPAPIRVPLDPTGIRLPGDCQLVEQPAGRADALRLRRDLAGGPVPAGGHPPALLQLAGRLAEPAPLNEAARALLAPWIDRLRPAVLRFLGQLDERGIHRLPARRPPDRLAR